MSQGNRRLPEGWVEVKLGDLAPERSDIAYGVLKPGDWTPGGVPMLRVKDIRENKVDGSEVYQISEELDRQYQRSKLAGGELLVSIQGTVGRVAVVPPEFTSANISRTLARVPLADPALSSWLHAALLSPQMQHVMTDQISGTTRDSLNLGELREIVVRVPPLPEQHRIVARIEELQARTRRAREALEAIPPLLERFRQSVLAAAFRGDLTADWRARNPDVEPASALLERIRAERPAHRRKAVRSAVAEMYSQAFSELPVGWELVRLGDVAHLQAGYAFKSSWFSSDGVRLLRGTNIEPGATRWNDVVHLPHERMHEFDEYLLRQGDIVIAMDRPLISTGLKIAIDRRVNI